MTKSFDEVKSELKTQFNIFSGSYVENSNISQLIDVLSYHYILMQNDNNLKYQNQYLDSVIYEEDMISILNQLGVNRASCIPNIAELPQNADIRGAQYTGEVLGNVYNFYSLNTNNKVYEGEFNTWNFTITDLNNNEFELTNSENLYLNEDSLYLTKDGIRINLSKDFITLNETNYYYIYENTNGNYIVRLNQTGDFVLEGFMVGSSTSKGIKTFTKVSDSSVLEAVYSSYGYSEKESIEEIRKNILSRMYKNNRAISIEDYNRIALEYFSNYDLYFYEETETPGLVYFSNKSDTQLNTSQIDEIVNKFESYFMIPGIKLEYKYKDSIYWFITIEVLLQENANNETNQSTISNDMLTTLQSYKNNISLFKFMQEMYDKYENNIADIKINNSKIQIKIENKQIVDLKNINGIIKLIPYLKHSIDANKMNFPVAYSGKLIVENVLSPVTFAKNDYVSLVPNIYFNTI